MTGRRNTEPTVGSPEHRDSARARSVGALVGGRYELVARVGRGGHGEVWKAIDTLRDERVAVKFFHRGDHGQAARVRREIAVLRMLRLPGVVSMLDEGFDDGGDEGAPFMVMELVDGEAFPARATPLPWDELADSALRLIEIVGRIHAAGVIHRDLKPSNVLVGHDRRVTVLDFGLSFPQSSVSDRLTAEFEFMGTPAYLAPEQLTGESIGPETDLFAVGVMLYEALTGALPHEGTHARSLLASRLTQAPRPLLERTPAVPHNVASVIMQMLERDRVDRPSAAELVLHRLRERWVPEVRALRRLGGEEPVRAIVDAAHERCALDIVGPSGLGRSRLLRDAASLLRSQGVTVLEASGGSAPLSTARSLTDALVSLDASASLDDAIERVTEALRSRLRAGVTVMIDDAELVDPFSAKVFERSLADGNMVRVFKVDPLVRAPRSVRLSPLRPEDLASIFAGPERLLRLTSDGAQRLFERTEGVAKAVVDELNAWVRAGLCRWADGQVVIDRAALDRIALDERPLRARLTQRASRSTSTSQELALPSHLSAVAQWLELAGGDVSTTALVSLTKEPRWQVEAALEELERRGVARRAQDRGWKLTAPSEAVGKPFESRSAAHRALAFALPRGRPGRILHLLASGASEDPASAEELVLEARLRAEELARDGAIGPATVLLSDALRSIRPMIDGGAIDPAPLLASWVELAIVAGTTTALDSALYEVTRVAKKTRSLAALEQLLRAALAVTVWDDRGVALVESLEPFDDPRLELARASVRVMAARRVSLALEERRIAEIGERFADATDPLLRARYAQWVARLAYRRGRFADAARTHSEAARSEPWLSLRTAALLDAGSAHMEAFEFESAWQCTEQARQLAVSSRNALLEGRAEWLLRAVAYRRGERCAVDRALLDAVERLGSRQLEALVCLGEAAFAFRAGSLGEASSLALSAYERWATLGETFGSLLAAALAVRCGATLAATALESVRQRAQSCSIPGVGIQALALLVASGERISIDDESLDRMAMAVPREHWSTPMELLSVRESLELLQRRAVSHG